MLMASGIFVPKWFPNQTGALHSHDGTSNDQRHEFPDHEAQELPLGRSNSRQELPPNTRSSAREV